MKIDINNIEEGQLVQDERIAQYLKGKMTADEEKDFIQELESNADLKAKTIAMARLAKGMKEVGDANDKELMDEFLSASADEISSLAKEATSTKEKAVANKAVANTITFRRMVAVLSAAASFALLIWAGIGFHDYRTTTGLGEEYATAFAASSLSRNAGENTEVEKKLSLLIENIANKKDMDNTLHELALCWELSTQETYNDYTDYAPEIGWNLAIGYLKDNDKKKAKVVLKKLTSIAPTGTAIGDKARELLKKVENL